jgi:hypothetical protein
VNPAGPSSIPFYSQTVNFEGEDSGFPNQDEIDRWQSNCCGIACARMIIDYHTGTNVRYWDLLQRGLQLRAYNDIGWIHKGLVDLAAEYGVEGRTHRGESVDELFQTLRTGNLCIVSASAGFRGGLKRRDSDAVFPKGGHLVVGFVTDEGEIACHHPSSALEWNKRSWVVPREHWERSFSGAYMEFFSRNGS